MLPHWACAEDGYGDGDGYGYGNGYGYGDGDGDGYGDGDGDGDGYGYGNGNGYGDGYGDGNGYGDGDKVFVPVMLGQYAPLAPPRSTLALWRSDKKGLPANGGASSQPASVGRVEEISGPLQICTRNALHATLDPRQWRGERIWVVALEGEIQRESDKLGALKRTIIAEISPNPWRD